MIFKVIIAGGRDFDDYDLLEEEVDFLLSNKIKEGYRIIIISGRARGADRLGERYAKARGYEVEYYPAEWDKYGKRAGMIRNGDMARVGDALIAFWDGKSKGTAGMIDIMERLRKPIRTINYDNGGD